jgi:hypothetical protein
LDPDKTNPVHPRIITVKSSYNYKLKKIDILQYSKDLANSYMVSLQNPSLLFLKPFQMKKHLRKDNLNSKSKPLD